MTKDDYEKRARERFLKKIKVNHKTGCWEWVGTKTRGGYGYGRFNYRGKLVCSHRFAFERFHRGSGTTIPEGMNLDHWIMNDNYEACSTSCCNPDHLELVTPKQNSNRSPRFRESRKKIGRKAGLSGRKNKLPEGVSINRKNYRATIHMTDRQIHLGTYTDPSHASQAYKLARAYVDRGFDPEKIKETILGCFWAVRNKRGNR